MTYKELLSHGEQILKESNVLDFSIDAFSLFEYVFGISRARYFIICNEMISDEEKLKEYLEMITLRSNRIPLQHITNTQEFMGLSFYVDENVLCPRQDTECLVELALSIISKNEFEKDCINVLDMCTGSGCIAVSIKTLGDKEMCMTAVDLSISALDVAKRNAISNKSDISFIHSNLFDNVDNIGYDMIVSNPPYIKTKDIEELMDEVKQHEPLMALDGYEDGLYFYRMITDKATEYLNQGGYLLYEIGFDQGEEVKTILLENGFDDIEIIKDLAGLDRIVKGRKIGGKQ